MITLHDLDSAIAKYQGLIDPKPSDAIKLAAFYILKNEMFGHQDEQGQALPSYSYASAPVEPIETTIDYQSDTEFSQAVDGRKASTVWPVMDELMEVLRVTNKPLYKATIRKIQD